MAVRGLRPAGDEASLPTLSELDQVVLERAVEVTDACAALTAAGLEEPRLKERTRELVDRCREYADADAELDATWRRAIVRLIRAAARYGKSRRRHPGHPGSCKRCNHRCAHCGHKVRDAERARSAPGRGPH